MYMSSYMNANLTKLLEVNVEMQTYQTRAITGKRINSASDGLAAYITAQGFDGRASRLNSINDGLTTVLSSIGSAKKGLEQIRKTLSDLRDTLKAASESQAQQGAVGVQQLLDTDAGSTQFQTTFVQRKGANAGDTVTFDTTFTQLGAAEKATETANAGKNQLYFGGLSSATSVAIREGTRLTFSAGVDSNSWTFVIGKIDPTSTTGTPGPVVDETNRTSTIYNLGQLRSILNERLNINFELAGNGNSQTASFVYNGPSFGTLQGGGADLTTKRGVGISISSAASGGIPADSSYLSTGANTALNMTNLFTSTRPTNNGASATYIADERAAGSTGTDTSVRIYGVQKNFTQAQTARTADAARANAARTYRNTIQTINNFARDSSSSGVNLLLGDQLRATLNEDGSSTNLQILNSSNAGALFSASGLRLVNSSGQADDASTDFARNWNSGSSGPGLLQAIDNVDLAISAVDSGATQVSGFEALIKGRKDFNDALAKLLNQASLDLTGADQTETAAKTSALQVQQSFAQTILSNQKQADQALLQLLR